MTLSSSVSEPVYALRFSCSRARMTRTFLLRASMQSAHQKSDQAGSFECLDHHYRDQKSQRYLLHEGLGFIRFGLLLDDIEPLAQLLCLLGELGNHGSLYVSIDTHVVSVVEIVRIPEEIWLR